MDTLFRLSQNIEGFSNIDETKYFFNNILPERDNNHFFNVNRLLQIKPNEIIYFAYAGYLVAKATFAGEIIEDYDRDPKYNFGHKLTNIQIINSNQKLNTKIFSTRTTYLDTKEKLDEIKRILDLSSKKNSSSSYQGENLTKEQVFEKWLILNNRPSRYSKTLHTISNDLKKEHYKDYDLYSVDNSHTLQKIKKDYLSIKKLFEKNKRGQNMYNSAFNRYIDFLKETEEDFLLDDIEKIIGHDIPLSTESKNLVKCRIGQGNFRDSLINYWKGCAVTKFDKIELLIASHIKPWSESTNSERLDLFNGLLLTPNLDKLFDKGYISFDNSGNILISSELNNYSLLGLKKEMAIEIKEEHKKYLEFHRNEIFKDYNQ
ncbi:HNH endonuclease signature motif containing protein [Sulfurovum sp. XTW-4]|uniref:HNH endonuclease signature motif containing protein n=1 Tax=Sulfurovum xiamenensis TaxID=3019066 RepID=A0ABT7QUF6_9BACT|nr:HNH endonuclease signature motif containing protein [Sulfurovum xiamenensis]MDM5264569.1 HNH endonuclease signature motif containing protein [Sulfurovum xiamenensis]